MFAFSNLHWNNDQFRHTEFGGQIEQISKQVSLLRPILYGQQLFLRNKKARVQFNCIIAVSADDFVKYTLNNKVS